MCWPNKINSMRYSVLLILLSIPAVFGADQAEAQEKSWTFSFYFENDLFADTDYNYTNGVKLTWISYDLTSYAKSGKLPDWSLPYIHRLPFIARTIAVWTQWKSNWAL
ncbi:MAG: hypothetical protein DRG35_05390 [Deltaproteobacteria bacterium]|nr:MAG: hypothetical protein DRG35_05390 [Deltaproteobacteria bacterium]